MSAVWYKVLKIQQQEVFLDQLSHLFQTAVRNFCNLGHFENTCSGTYSRVSGCACSFDLITWISSMMFRNVGYSGICMCAATEFAALELLHGAVCAWQCFAAPAPAHAAAHIEKPLLDWPWAIFFIHPKLLSQPQSHIRRHSLSSLTNRKQAFVLQKIVNILADV